MHDTHLIQKLYRSIMDLCSENAMDRINEICIEVDEGSHIDSAHLLSHFKELNSVLIGDWTTVRVVRRPLEALTAVIKSIDGDVCE